MARQTWRSYRKESREDFGDNHEEGYRPCDQQISAGCLARIADAVEKMVKPYQTLIEERDKYERWFREASDDKARLYRQMAGLRGTITKLKKK